MRLTTMDDLRFKALQKAPLDSWVAFADDDATIVAIGNSYEDVVEKSEKAGVSDPVLLKTPKEWLPISV